MATREVTPPTVLEWIRQVKRECDNVPVGVLSSLELLGELCVKQQAEIDRLRAFAFGPTAPGLGPM